MFSLKLSVSTQVAKDKAAAAKITKYDFRELTLEEGLLKEIFTTRNYSTNQWKNGHCKNENYISMTGITIDIDQGMSIPDAKKLFEQFNYIIHTSTSHKVDDPRKGGVQDRFRVILPFDPSQYDTFNTQELAEGVYAVVMSKYTFVDGSCKDPARKYYPFLNKTYPGLWELHINDVGTYFSVSMDDVQTTVAGLQDLKKTSDKSGNAYTLKLDTEFLLKDKKTKMKLRDFTFIGSTPVYCIFCDDINSKDASGAVWVHDDGKRFLWCSHCNRNYYLSLAESYPHLFYVGDTLTMVKDHFSDVSAFKVPGPYLNHLPPEMLKEFLHKLANTKIIPPDLFTISRMVDAYADKVHWELDIQHAALKVYIPPIGVKVKDNDYIDRWLNETFGEYAEFIKDWMAIWTHENYQTLPMLIFNGERGSGKTTFGEFLLNMYPSLVGEWKGDVNGFTDFHEKKLLLIEETAADKREQYEEIKRLGGVGELTINKKFQIPYRVKNNISIILMTNNFAPLFLQQKERPKGPQDNQFFMYTFKSKGRINARIKDELAERAGYYLRTELRERYETWKQSPTGRLNRYGIPCPLTPLLEQQFNDAHSNIDYEATDVYQALIRGIVRIRTGVADVMLGPYTTVTFHELSQIAKMYRLSTKSIKTLRERLQALGFLETTNQQIRKNGSEAWTVVPPSSPPDPKPVTIEG